MSISSLPVPRPLARVFTALAAQLDRMRRRVRQADVPEPEIALFNDDIERELVDRELRRWRNT